MIYKNEEQGVELEIFADLSAELRTTKPRNESMLGLVVVNEWAEQVYLKHIQEAYSKPTEDFQI